MNRRLIGQVKHVDRGDQCVYYSHSLVYQAAVDKIPAKLFSSRLYDFDGRSSIYPYANLSDCNNLRNILRRDDNHLLQWVSLKNKKYDPERTKDTQVKAIDVEAVIGCNGETVPIAVSLVNYYGYPLIDTYVHPFTPVRDWVSDVTGIDAYDWCDLVNAGDQPILTYNQVMQNIEEYLDDDDVLVGHNIDNDIEILGLDTDGLEIIDTQAEISGLDGLPYQPGLARV